MKQHIHKTVSHAWSLLEFPECREYQHKFDSELLPKIKDFKRKADKLKYISYSVWLEGCDCDISKFTEWGYVNGIPINELNIQCDWKIKGISDKNLLQSLISRIETMLHQSCFDIRHKYFREEGLGCSYDDWYAKLKKVDNYIRQRVGDSSKMKSYSYKGRLINANSKEEAIKKVITGSEKDGCSLKRIFEHLYPTDVTFEYHSTSKDGAYIKVILYIDLWIDIYAYSKYQFRVIKHDNNSEQKEKELYWSYKELVEYLNINYEG